MALWPILSCLPPPDVTKVLPVAFSFANIFAWYFFQWMKMAGNSLAYNNNGRKYNPLLNYCIVLENIHPTPHNSNWAPYFSLKTLPFNYTLFCCWWDYLDLKLLTRWWWKNVHKEMQAKPICSLTKIVPILKLFFSYFTSYFIPIWKLFYPYFC